MHFPHANIADRLSVYPVAQQFVGALTIGSNLVKMGRDVVKSLYNIAINILSNLSREPEAFKEKFSATTDYKEHFRYIIVGVIRMIPVLATLYSINHCKNEEIIACCERNSNARIRDMTKQLDEMRAGRSAYPSHYKF